MEVLGSTENFDLVKNTLSSLLIVYVTFKVIKWLANYIERVRLIGKVHGKPMLPFIGNLHQISLKRDDFLDNINMLSEYSKDHPMFRFWSGIQPSILFHKADNLEALFSGHKNNDKAYEYSFLHPWLGTGLLTSGGDKWYKRRRLLTPTFHFEILNDFLQVMNEQAEILVDILSKPDEKSKSVDIYKKLNKCALDIICETAMGQNVNAQYDHESEYVQAVGKMSEKIVDRINKPYVWNDMIYYRTKDGEIHQKCLKTLHDFTRKVIMERDANFDLTDIKNQKRVAFLDMLLKAKREDASLTFDDIQEEVDTFMFEGHDTTTAALSWTCQMIGTNMDVQKKLHEEIDIVFGSSNRQLESEDLGELKYLECVIKETLRLFPSVPMFSRAIQEEQKIGEFLIPKDCTATVVVSMIHRDQRYYPDPEKFDPDRFLPENSADRPPFAYIPFSAGKRNCIGQRFAMMELKVVLANLLRCFELKSCEATENIKKTNELILRPLNGIHMELKLRSFNES